METITVVLITIAVFVLANSIKAALPNSQQAKPEILHVQIVEKPKPEPGMAGCLPLIMTGIVALIVLAFFGA